MVDDPYKALGVPRDASKDEIKKAYRQKAKMYHPDLHPDDPAANEKMNEINEAYDMLNNPEKYRGRQRGAAGQGNPYGPSYGQDPYGSGRSQAGQGNYQGQGSYGGGQGQWGQDPWNRGYRNYEDIFGEFFGGGNAPYGPARPEAEAYDSPEIRQVIQLINSGQHQYASEILNRMAGGQRNARWHYLSALAGYGAGNQIFALEQIRQAVRMEPDNLVYRNAMQSMQRPGRAYNEMGRQYRTYDNTMGQLCWSLFAMQFCCMCCHF